MSPATEFAKKLAVNFHDADEIADFCRANGIKGYMGSPRYCPLARIAKRWFPEWEVEVAQSIWDGPPSNPAPGFAPTPKAAATFRDRFDAGRYPDLVDTGYLFEEA